MSKTLPATCVGNVVTSEGVPVEAARVLSKGVAQSEGVLIVDEDRADYIPNTTPDLESALDSISSALGSIASALTTIDTKVMVTTCGAGAGTAGPTPLAAAAIAQVNTAKAQVDALKASLK